ncbi:MAG: S1C family serine protease, partial [Taibaiella sp.]|nr:S1C family serine protease [Taibaiella sp.]
VNPGMVSNLNGFKGEENKYTITASLQPGNSGGPIFDNYGRIVGVAVGILEASAINASGISYAIPAEYVSNIIFGIDRIVENKFAGAPEDSAREELSGQEISNIAKEITVQIICRAN